MGIGETASREETRPSSAATAALAEDVSAPAGPSEVARRARSAAMLPFAWALATLAFTYWCVDIVSPALPDVQRSLALSATGAGLVFSVFFAGRLVTNLPAALLLDRGGPRRTALLGACLLLVGSVLATVASGQASLLPARGLQGSGVALLASAGLLSLLRARPAGGAAMTAFNVATGVGGSAGLMTGGVLTSELGWRAVFALSALLSLGLLLGSSLARATSAPGPIRDAVVHPAGETLLAAPGRRALVGALLANLLVFSNYSVWVVALPLYVAERFDASAERIATLLLVVNVVHLLAAIPFGRLIRRAGPLRALTVGLGLAGLGMALMVAAPNQGWLLGPMVLYAVGQVAGNSAAGDLLLRIGGGGGRAVGMVRLTSDVGLVVGPAAAGAIADAAGVGAPFPVLATLTGVAAIAVWRAASRPRPNLPNPPPNMGGGAGA